MVEAMNGNLIAFNRPQASFEASSAPPAFSLRSFKEPAEDHEVQGNSVNPLAFEQGVQGTPGSDPFELPGEMPSASSMVASSTFQDGAAGIGNGSTAFDYDADDSALDPMWSESFWAEGDSSSDFR